MIDDANSDGVRSCFSKFISRCRRNQVLAQSQARDLAADSLPEYHVGGAKDPILAGRPNNVTWHEAQAWLLNVGGKDEASPGYRRAVTGRCNPHSWLRS